MANPHKGEVALQVKDKTYTVLFTVDAICQLEEATGKGLVALSAELQDPEKVSVALLRKFLWAGLRERHPEVTLKQAGEMIPPAGGLMKVMEQLNLAFARAFPEGEKAADETAQTERPREPGQNGTGSASTETGAS